jgi:hypothetical protein
MLPEVVTEMNNEELETARFALISGLSVRQLVDDLNGERYADLVLKHVRDTEARLPAKISLHESLLTQGERAKAKGILKSIESETMHSDFWGVSAGDVLTKVSCDLNDALYPEPADDAGVFNLFQLVTARLANRARLDTEFKGLITSPTNSGVRVTRSGTITRMLGVAVNDYDAGRISRGALLSIFQDAIDNGDILEDNNLVYVVTKVLPLVDAGLLRPSHHLDLFEARMAEAARNFVNPRRSKGHKWWRFWK